MSEEVSFEYVKTLKDDNNVYLIDVREPAELESTGSIPGSLNIPLSKLEQNLQNEELFANFHRSKPDLNTPLVFSCQSGRRSKMALETARKIGFLNVKHFPGGWAGWEQAIKNN